MLRRRPLRLLVLACVSALLSSACAFDDGGPKGLAGWTDLGPKADVAPPADSVAPCRDESCPFGCHPQENRCYRLTPSNFDPAPIYEGATEPLTLDSGERVLIDTTNGTIEVDGALLDRSLPFVSQLASGAPKIRLLAVDSFEVTKETLVKIRGDYALIIYARDAITIAGTLDASADGALPGPGGRQGGNGDTNEAPDHAKVCGWGNRTGGEGEGGKRVLEWATGLTVDSGGGGGGWGSRGASGGAGGPCNNVGPANHGGGGDPVADDASYLLAPLLGGCGGGAGGGPDEFTLERTPPATHIGGDGGGGGGALQLTAGNRLAIKAGAIITVGGGGGEPGGEWAGGGGGGSGGSLLLEASAFELGGILAANGGGGGAGGPALPEPTRAHDGEDGTTSKAPAQGGPISSVSPTFGGFGGNGAALDADAIGGQGGVNICNAGGGGGGVGRIVIVSGAALSDIGASPAALIRYEIKTW